VIPLGTGNDLAGALGLPEDPFRAIEELSWRQTITADVIRVRAAETERYALNAVTAGFSAVVDEVLETRSKELLGPLSYLVTAGRALPELEEHHLDLEVDDTAERSLEVFNLVLVNGRTIGGGVPVAPRARLDDGSLRLLLVPAMPLPRLALAIGRLLGQDPTEIEELETVTVTRTRLHAEPAMALTADGEVFSTTPAEVEVLPRALRCVVGQEYEPETD
jgi:diacylglycerol kinase (ATP)